MGAYQVCARLGVRGPSLRLRRLLPSGGGDKGGRRSILPLFSLSSGLRRTSVAGQGHAMDGGGNNRGLRGDLALCLECAARERLRTEAHSSSEPSTSLLSPSPSRSSVLISTAFNVRSVRSRRGLDTSGAIHGPSFPRYCRRSVRSSRRRRSFWYGTRTDGGISSWRG